MVGHRRVQTSGALFATALALASAAGCALPGPMELEPAAAPGEGLPREQLESLEHLRLAVDDGEAAVARGILTGILARNPAPEVLRAADAYRRILDGRECAELLDLRLVAEPGELEGHTRVALVATSALADGLVLHLLPPTLVRRVYSVSPRGIESRNRRGEVRTDLVRVEFVAGESTTAFLGEFPRTVSGALAIRETYDLLPGGAWLERDGELLPAQSLEVVAAERTSVAGFLSSAPVDPEAVADYVAAAGVLEIPDEIFLPALLERAVRVAPSQRTQAIDRLAADVEGWSDEQIAAAAPALRWLTDAVLPDSDPRAWRSWLAAWRRPPVGDGATALVLPR